MKKLLLVAFLMIGLLYSLSAEAAIFRMALILGNNEGASDQLPLRYAEQDAKNFYQTLTQIGDFPKNQVKLLLGKNPATISEAIRSLQFQAKNLTQNQWDQILLVVYFSGHSEKGLLQFGDDEWSPKVLYDEIKKIPATTKLYIFDTCQSGEFIQSKGGVPVPPLYIDLQERKLPQGELVITSSTALEDSLESSELGGSLFTHYLLSGLRGAADFNSDGQVSATEMYSYASEQTTHKSSKLPKTQHPTYNFNLTGEGEVFLSFLNRGAPLLSIPPSEQGEYLIYNKLNRNLILEFEKRSGSTKTIALPEGNLLIRKKGMGYFVEEEISARSGGIYQFQEETGRRVQISSVNRLLATTSATKAKPVTIHEGEVIRLQLAEEVSTKNNHTGDKIRLEAVEDVYVDGRIVITAGSSGSAEITSLKEKKGYENGELVLRIGYVQSMDGQWVPLESIVARNPSGLTTVNEEGQNKEESPGLFTRVGHVLLFPFYPLLKGKDVIIPVGTEFQAYVARDVKVN